MEAQPAGTMHCCTTSIMIDGVLVTSDADTPNSEC
jgi:hypothetical protein